MDECENCGVSAAENDSVQKRMCDHVLCEDCMPCPFCEAEKDYE